MLAPRSAFQDITWIIVVEVPRRREERVIIIVMLMNAASDERSELRNELGILVRITCGWLQRHLVSSLPIACVVVFTHTYPSP